MPQGHTATDVELNLETLAGQYTATQVADYFLRRTDLDAGDVMTNLRLQKLVYFAQGWHLAFTQRVLFRDRIEAWVHGPVIPSLYARFKPYGWKPIDTTQANAPCFDDATLEILDEVWNVYGQYSAKRLEELTHAEDPWRRARAGYDPGERCTVEITPQAMQLFYTELLKSQA